MYPYRPPTGKDWREGSLFFIAVFIIGFLLFPIIGLIMILWKGGWDKSPSLLKNLWLLSIVITAGVIFVLPMMSLSTVPKGIIVTERPTATTTPTRTPTLTATATYTATPTITVTPNITATRLIEHVAATRQASPNQQLSILYPGAGTSISGNELTIAWNSRELNNKDFYFINIWKEAEGTFTFACATVTQQRDKRDKTVNFLTLDWKDTCSLTGSGHKTKPPIFTATFKVNITIFNGASAQPGEKSSDIEFEWQR